MKARTGIFAGLRRRRWALSLAFGYALLLNALLGTSLEAAMAAAGNGPLAVAAAGPICSPGNPAPASNRHTPADHQQTCPICGPACPMGGCAPLQTGAGALALAAPSPVTRAAVDWPRVGPIGGRSLYSSDTDSQGPPAA